ncbi:MAG: D-glycero-beta-D-manno-heptose 1-phosphate adenylyltransferase [Gemmataceae bacterium]|nr:D-glycero-beta-D-manno-heptose 1-phosphate adenylyltransferase [Gemmataceae bacterium]
MAADLVELVENLGTPRVLVVGDLMLDRYIWGNAARVSQEAPVLLLRADKREERLGGAASVAALLRALDAEVALAGGVGGDEGGARIRELLDERGIDHSAVVSDSDRPSTVKERYIGRAQARHPQQILRVDYETCDSVSGTIEAGLLASVARAVPECDAVLISDYDKGVCTPSLLAEVIRLARAAGIPVLADPTRGGDYAKYRGCTAITPNRLEASLASGIEITGTSSALIAAERLLHRYDLDAAVVTLDKDGMALADRQGRRAIYPTRPRQVYDITGAGDMVLGTLGIALASGADFPEAIRLANVSGGLEVEKIGVAPVSRAEIVEDLHQHEPRDLAPVGKVVEAGQLLRELQRHRRAGHTVAFTNGCFDVLHAGHVQYLHEARAQADVLVVAVNSDASVRGLKGPTRPVNPWPARSAVLAGLESVNFIVSFDEATPLALIEAVRPDVLVKGADYSKEQVVGATFVESYGGRVHLAPLRPGYSTTNTLRQLQAA